MPTFPADAPISKVIKALERLGFHVVREGNHIAMLRENPDGTRSPLTIPNHPRVKGVYPSHDTDSGRHRKGFFPQRLRRELKRMPQPSAEEGAAQKTRNARTVRTLFIGLSIFLAAVVVGWPTAPLHATGTSGTVTASGNVTVDADSPSIPALNHAGQSANAPACAFRALGVEGSAEHSGWIVEPKNWA